MYKLLIDMGSMSTSTQTAGPGSADPPGVLWRFSDSELQPFRVKTFMRKLKVGGVNHEDETLLLLRDWKLNPGGLHNTSGAGQS